MTVRCLNVLDRHSFSALHTNTILNCKIIICTIFQVLHACRSWVEIFCPPLQAQVIKEVEAECFPELWLLADRVTLRFLATALMHFIRWLIHAGSTRVTTRVTTVCPSLMVTPVYAPDPKICPVLTAHSLGTSPSEVLLVFNSNRQWVGH